MTATISIVIPARNDAVALRRTLDHLATLPGIGDAEVIVAAAGDAGGTARAVSGRARLLWPPDSSRATLMNAGAAVARGEVLFFLHADSFPPPHAFALIRGVLADPRAVGGAFEHLFAEPVPILRLITWINRIRYRLTRNYYGDQGIFVRAAVFRAMGGFKPFGLLEDLEFTRRLQRRGRSVLIRAPLRTSGRRFLARGPVRTFLLMVWLIILHTLGLDTERYADRYRGPSDLPPGAAPRDGARRRGVPALAAAREALGTKSCSGRVASAPRLGRAEMNSAPTPETDPQGGGGFHARPWGARFSSSVVPNRAHRRLP